uniref:Uncharacterized protein n=1 Tax=Romanomermis culicivorax TaxID=13658 RepID=A0A915L0Z9_ROMCU
MDNLHYPNLEYAEKFGLKNKQEKQDEGKVDNVWDINLQEALQASQAADRTNIALEGWALRSQRKHDV